MPMFITILNFDGIVQGIEVPVSKTDSSKGLFKDSEVKDRNKNTHDGPEPKHPPRPCWPLMDHCHRVVFHIVAVVAIIEGVMKLPGANRCVLSYFVVGERVV